MELRILIALIHAAIVVTTSGQSTCGYFETQATCTIDGTNIKTFDGKHFNYAICNHILMQNTCQNKWKIIERQFCNAIGICRKQLEITQKTRVLTITHNLAVEYNGFTYSVAQAHVVGSLQQEFTMFYSGRSVYFKSLLYGFWVQFDQLGNIKIGVPEEMMHKINGLCGKFNKNPDDDITTSTGNTTAMIHEFASSWQVPGTDLRNCPNLDCSNEIRNEAFVICSNITRSSPLDQCLDVVDVDFCLNKCVKDYCYCASNGRRSDCRCEVIQKFMQHCQTEAPNMDLSAWRDSNQCVETCPTGMVYMDCNKRLCEPSCNNLYDPNACPVEEGTCHAGCFCAEGLVRKGDICVRPEQCKDCVCKGYGDPHYITYDGTTYDFQGQCTYVASTGIPNNSGGQFKVLVTNVPCGTATFSCTSAVTVVYNLVNASGVGQEMVIQVNRNSPGGKRLVTRINNSEVSSFPYQGNWVHMQSVMDNHVTIFVPEAQLEVSYYYRSWTFVIRISSQLYTAQNLSGLCGNCNKNKNDDLLLRNGTLTTNINDFGLNWLARDIIELPAGMRNEPHCREIVDPPEFCLPGYPVAPQNDRCLQILDKSKFGQCHLLVDPSSYVEACQFDLCHNEDRETALCAAVHAYAKACQSQGLCIDWRREDFCPFECPTGKEYRACGTGCDITCTNYWLYRDNTSACEIEPSEGCFCPNGLINKGNRCVGPEGCKDCSCTGWGDPHFYNFDQTYFAFQGNCTYIVSRDKLLPTSSSHLFQVWVTNKASASCGRGTTCPVGIVIFFNDHIVHAFSDENNWRIRTELDGTVLTEFPVQTQWLLIQSYWGHQKVTIYIPELELEATLQRNRFSLRVPSHTYANNTEGLCGNCNNNRTDDFMTIDGENARRNINGFGLSWLVTNTSIVPGMNASRACSIPSENLTCQPGYPLPAGRNPCLWILDTNKFGQCHGVVSPDPYVQACEFDMCHSENRDAIRCNAAEAYAEQCRSQGVCVDWRSQDICPLNCPVGTIYRSCGSGCVENCDNYQMYRRNPNLCGLETSEGCYCPEGQVFQNSQCIMEAECNATCELQSLQCQVIDVPLSSMPRTISLVDPAHGQCFNKFPLPQFKMCHGFCASKPIFQDGSISADSQCCETSTQDSVAILMRCQDGAEYPWNVTYPSGCRCNGCRCRNPLTTTTQPPTVTTERTSSLPITTTNLPA